MRPLGWLDLRLACTRHLRNCRPSAEQPLSRLRTSSGRFFVSAASLRTRSDLDLHLRESFNKATRLMDTHERYKGWEPSALLDRIAHLEKDLESARSKEGRGADGAVKPAGPRNAEAGPSKQRVTKTQASSSSSSSSSPTPPKKDRPFDYSDMPVRKIALRFAYDGEHYSGLASQGDGVPDSASSANATNELPTVELMLWNALCATRLVDPALGFRGVEWSRSGRTDRGVSAAGQVVSFWARSTKVDERELRKAEEARARQKYEEGKFIYEPGGEDEDPTYDIEPVEGQGDDANDVSSTHNPWSNSPLRPGKSRADQEINYVVAINRLLPPSIRILGWSPVRPSFNARYNTRYRHYKYFFSTGPPLQLLPPRTHASHRTVPPRLDIESMQEAASFLLGEHDFRNLCKVDPSKQITNFRRRIDGVSIDKVESSWPMRGHVDDAAVLGQSTPADHEQMYVFNLRGTAFLYHQVRDIMAILFLVGAKLEKPSIVKELLNVHEGAWDGDKQWLIAAGVERLGEVKLPKGTSTELDGATAAEPEALVKEILGGGGGGGTTAEPSASSPPSQRLLSTSDDDDDDGALITFPRQPEYVMAHDRPLVLWECGYRPKDVSWRSGAYDGPLSDVANLTAADQHDLITGASRVTEELHTQYSQRAISAEIWRHFTLAADTPRSYGLTDSGVLYEDSRHPRLSSCAVADDENDGRQKEFTRSTMTVGYGISRPLNAWKGLAKAKMQETPEEKNKKWREGKFVRKQKRLQAASAAEAQAHK